MKIHILFYFACFLKFAVGNNTPTREGMQPSDNSRNEEAQLISALRNGKMDEARNSIKAGVLEKYLTGKTADQRMITLEKIHTIIRTIELLLSTGIAVINNGTNANGSDVTKGSFEVVLVPGTNYVTILKIDEAAVKSWGNKPIKNGEKPLHVICSLPDVHPEIVQTVLDNSEDNINIKTNMGATPLLYATVAGNFDLVKFLIGKGACLNESHLKEIVPNEVQEKSGRYAYLKVLSNKEVNIPPIQFRYSPLVAAAWENHQDILKYLISKGADINNRGQSWGVLFNPVVHGKTDIAEILLQNGINVNSMDALGLTALHKAAEKGDREMVKLLIKYGANLNATDLFDWTPFHVASFYSGKVGQAMLEVLAEAGSDVLARTDSGYSPLNLVQAGSNEHLLKYLVENIESLNTTSYHGGLKEDDSSAQHVAIVNYVISRGASFNDQDDILGFSPLHWAAASGDLNVAKTLVNYGVVVSTRSKMGLNPFETANYFGMRKTADYLKNVKDLL